MVWAVTAWSPCEERLGAMKIMQFALKSKIATFSITMSRFQSCCGQRRGLGSELHQSFDQPWFIPSF
jgi:hypothetical protein